MHGKALGRTVGMPTANLCVESGELPKPGVYATKITIDHQSFVAVTNIGTRPSVDRDDAVTVEAHILDFHEDIYGKYVSLEVLEFLRPIQKFNGLEEVKEQVKKDIEKTKKYLDTEKTK